MEKEKHKEQDQEMPTPLLNLKDWKGKIDFSSDENCIPFDCLCKVASIASDKILQQDRSDEIINNENRQTLSGTSTSTTTITITSSSSSASEVEDKRICVERKTIWKEGRGELLRRGCNKSRVPRQVPSLYIETELEGREIKLMVQKKLFKSDVNPAEGRLSVPHKKLLPGVLTKEEEDRLGGRGGGEDTCGGGAAVGMKVKLVDPSLKVWDATLKRWNMSKKNGTVNYIYVVTSPWNDVVRENGLEQDEVVQLWGFRMGGSDPGQLGLALVQVDSSEAR